MTIYGLSQTSGAERRLFIDRVDAGVLMEVHDDEVNAGGHKIVVCAADIVAQLNEPDQGGKAIAGTSPVDGTPQALRCEVRGNEVQLWFHIGSEVSSDIAVGFDDFQDAIAAAA